jgi:hypothetical protein
LGLIRSLSIRAGLRAALPVASLLLAMSSFGPWSGLPSFAKSPGPVHHSVPSVAWHIHASKSEGPWLAQADFARNGAVITGTMTFSDATEARTARIDAKVVNGTVVWKTKSVVGYVRTGAFPAAALSATSCDCTNADHVISILEVGACIGLTLLCGVGVGAGEAAKKQCTDACATAGVPPDCVSHVDPGTPGQPMSGVPTYNFSGGVSCDGIAVDEIDATYHFDASNSYWASGYFYFTCYNTDRCDSSGWNYYPSCSGCIPPEPAGCYHMWIDGTFRYHDDLGRQFTKNITVGNSTDYCG